MAHNSNSHDVPWLPNSQRDWKHAKLEPAKLLKKSLHLATTNNTPWSANDGRKSYPGQTCYMNWAPKWHHVTWLQGQKIKGQGHNLT